MRPVDVVVRGGDVIVVRGGDVIVITDFDTVAVDARVTSFADTVFETSFE